jgi:anti-sigma factor RsiW
VNDACTVLAGAIDDVALGASASSALAAHLTTCAACAMRLEQKRLLAQRIDRAIGAFLAAEPAPGLPERIAARVPMQRPRRRRIAWRVAPVGVALAAGLVVFISSFGGLRGTAHAPDIAAIVAWRSPTASLLVSRSSVLGAPFTLRGPRDGVGRSRS